MLDLLFIDCETTGLDPDIHEIVEFAMIRLTLDQAMKMSDLIIREAIKDIYVAPRHIQTASEYALKINGYDKAEWKERGARPWGDVIQEISKVALDTLPVGWNVDFDLDFVRHECRKHGVAQPAWDYHKVDLANFAFPLYALGKIESLSMSKVGPYLGVENKNAHRADSDVITSIMIFRRMVQMGLVPLKEKKK